MENETEANIRTHASTIFNKNFIIIQQYLTTTNRSKHKNIIQEPAED